MASVRKGAHLQEKAREESIRIMSRRADERETLKEHMLKEESFAFDRMVAHYKQRDLRWSEKLTKNPFAVDLVASDKKAYQNLLEANATEQRKAKHDAELARRIQRECLRRTARDRDEMAELRADKRRLLQEQHHLFARTELERFNSRVTNMSTPVRCCKYAMAPEARRLKGREMARNKAEAAKKALERGAPVSTEDEEEGIDLQQIACEIMYAGDRISQDGELEIHGLVTLLSSGPAGRKRFGAFTDWLGTSTKMRRLRCFGNDGRVTLSLENLQQAVAAFLDEQVEDECDDLESPTTSSPASQGRRPRFGSTSSCPELLVTPAK
eukprot:TRINITY_DN54876_c0_g1_i1.p1 TRINITY_DN54876_c0_g1~~TRINITY_DN54876_c0_g1_i1.p1  ORF type:complete len:347 (+),score=67.98 TRINITY_DN54876_c0_g1_i1:64-1041(+)